MAARGAGNKKGSIRLEYPEVLWCGVSVVPGREGSTLVDVSQSQAVLMALRGAGSGVERAVYTFAAEMKVCEEIATRRAEADERARIRRSAKETQKRLLDDQKLMEMRRKDKEREEQVRRQKEEEMKAKDRLRQAQRQQEMAMQLLTEDQKKMLSHFQSIAGSNDFDVSRAFLERFGWDVADAIANFYEFNGDITKIPNSPSASSVSAGSTQITMVFPDQASETVNFKTTDTLWIIFEWVYGKASRWGGTSFNLGYKKEPLAPTTLYTEADYDQSLEELGFVPSGTIYIGKV